MKAFKIYSDGLYYAYAAMTKELAINQFKEEISDEYEEIEEIPESEWDKKEIKIYEDNDRNSEPWTESIREIICGTEPQMIFTNDTSLF